MFHLPSSSSTGSWTEQMRDQNENPLFCLPPEVRNQIYGYLVGPCILHIEAKQPYSLTNEGFELETTSDRHCMADSDRPLQTHWRCDKMFVAGDYDNAIRISSENEGPKSITQDAARGRLFALYYCATEEAFESASACPPGHADHELCGEDKVPYTLSLRRTCQQAYKETAELARLVNEQTALQFASLKDVVAFSLLLSDPQLKKVRDIRVNVEVLQHWHYSRCWQYFCNVFAAPWDRGSLRQLFGAEYPNDLASISFHYRSEAIDITGVSIDRRQAADQAMKAHLLAGVALRPALQLYWRFADSIWSTPVDVSMLEAREPTSIRLAVPIFYDINHPEEPDHSEHLILDESVLVRNFVNARNDIGVCEDEGLQTLLREGYEIEFKEYWHKPAFRRQNWIEEPRWLQPLEQCQGLAAFDIQFYDELGLSSTEALEVLREGLKERLTHQDVGPHPCLFFTHTRKAPLDEQEHVSPTFPRNLMFQRPVNPPLWPSRESFVHHNSL